MTDTAPLTAQQLDAIRQRANVEGSDEIKSLQIINLKHDLRVLLAEVDRLRAELATAHEQLETLAVVKVWRNEDDREFLFADDVRRAMGLVHACPPGNSALTPCCGKTPFELARTDRLTYDQADITCPAVSPSS